MSHPSTSRSLPAAQWWDRGRNRTARLSRLSLTAVPIIHPTDWRRLRPVVQVDSRPHRRLGQGLGLSTCTRARSRGMGGTAGEAKCRATSSRKTACAVTCRAAHHALNAGPGLDVEPDAQHHLLRHPSRPLSTCGVNMADRRRPNGWFVRRRPPAARAGRPQLSRICS